MESLLYTPFCSFIALSYYSSSNAIAQEGALNFGELSSNHTTTNKTTAVSPSIGRTNSMPLAEISRFNPTFNQTI
jgi:hypothetical protein